MSRRSDIDFDQDDHREIIAQFGGPSALAGALDIHQSQINDWQSLGTIPKAFHAKIKRLVANPDPQRKSKEEPMSKPKSPNDAIAKRYPGNKRFTVFISADAAKNLAIMTAQKTGTKDFAQNAAINASEVLEEALKG